MGRTDFYDQFRKVIICHKRKSKKKAMNRNWYNQKANPVKGQENDKRLHTTPED